LWDTQSDQLEFSTVHLGFSAVQGKTAVNVRELTNGEEVPFGRRYLTSLEERGR
jgi:hypothetical protein